MPLLSSGITAADTLPCAMSVMFGALRFLRWCANPQDAPNAAGLLAICRNVCTDTVSAEKLRQVSQSRTRFAEFGCSPEPDAGQNVSQVRNDDSRLNKTPPRNPTQNRSASFVLLNS